jgi:hypothetical protein
LNPKTQMSHPAHRSGRTLAGRCGFRRQLSRAAKARKLPRTAGSGRELPVHSSRRALAPRSPSTGGLLAAAVRLLAVAPPAIRVRGHVSLSSDLPRFPLHPQPCLLACHTPRSRNLIRHAPDHYFQRQERGAGAHDRGGVALGASPSIRHCPRPRTSSRAALNRQIEGNDVPLDEYSGRQAEPPRASRVTAPSRASLFVRLCARLLPMQTKLSSLAADDEAERADGDMESGGSAADVGVRRLGWSRALFQKCSKTLRN